MPLRSQLPGPTLGEPPNSPSQGHPYTRPGVSPAVFSSQPPRGLACGALCLSVPRVCLSRVSINSRAAEHGGVPGPTRKPPCRPLHKHLARPMDASLTGSQIGQDESQWLSCGRGALGPGMECKGRLTAHPGCGGDGVTGGRVAEGLKSHFEAGPGQAAPSASPARGRSKPCCQA